jgi:hypothetical protein
MVVMKYLAQSFEKLKSEKKWKIEFEEYDKLLFQPFLMGNLERFFFTVMIAFEGIKVVPYFIPWIGLKMLTGWNRFKKGEIPYRTLAFNALIGNMVSLFIAFCGGIIIYKW